MLSAMRGVPDGDRMRPEEIEELMRTMNQPKIVRKFAEAEEHGDDPLPIAESRIS